MNKDYNSSLVIPFKLILRRNFLKALLTTLAAVAIIIAFQFLPSDGDKVLAVVKALFLLFAAAIIYVFVFNDILHKSSIEVTHEYIKQRAPYGTRLLCWHEADDIDIISMNRQKSIVISRTSKPGKKESFWRALNAEMGGNYYINIPVVMLEGVDVDELFTVLRDKLISELKENDAGNTTSDVQVNEDAGEVRVNNYTAAVIKITLSSLAVGLLYGFSIILLRVNIILIPLLGVMYIGYVHDRNYKGETRSILRNFVLGVICSLQFPAAYLGMAFIGVLKEGDLMLLPTVLSELVQLILSEPMDHFLMIFLFVGCIIWVTFMDVSFRSQRQWKKLFMKRMGGYYYERRSHIFDIYLVDPVDYDENREGSLIAAFGVGYLVEKDGKKPAAFYLPKEGIEQLGIIIPEAREVTIDKTVYLKIYFGGRGDIEPYAYKGALICNKDKEAQLLEIEYLQP